MKKWLLNQSTILKSLGALALCFVMALVITGAVCLPVRAYAESVDDTGASLATSSDIGIFAKITFDPPLPANGGYLNPNQQYRIHFDVKEEYAKGITVDGGSKVDFLFDVAAMYYLLPEGLDYTLTIPQNGKLSLKAKTIRKIRNLRCGLMSAS